MLANLVDNAIKYTPSGGRVTVSAAADGDSIRIEVADTGIGIAAHDLPRIWERLYRGDHSRAERGLGLGLSLVRAIVRAHGGTVDVRTELGRGSTFTIRLPRAHPTAVERRSEFVVLVHGSGFGFSSLPPNPDCPPEPEPEP